MTLHPLALRALVATFLGAFLVGWGLLPSSSPAPASTDVAFAQGPSCQTSCCEDILVYFHAAGDDGTGRSVVWRGEPTGVTHDVTLTGSGFVPSSLTIATGDLVRFTNGGPGPHEATGFLFGTEEFRTGPLLEGDTATIGPFGVPNTYDLYDSFGGHTGTLTVTGAWSERFVPVRFKVRYCMGASSSKCADYYGTINADGVLVPDPGWPTPVLCEAIGGGTVPGPSAMVSLDYAASFGSGGCTTTTTNFPILDCFVDSDYELRIARKVEGGLEFSSPLCFQDIELWVDQSADVELSQRRETEPCAWPDSLTLLPEPMQRANALRITKLDIAEEPCEPGFGQSLGGPDEDLCLIGLFQ